MFESCILSIVGSRLDPGFQIFPIVFTKMSRCYIILSEVIEVCRQPSGAADQLGQEALGHCELQAHTYIQTPHPAWYSSHV